MRERILAELELVKRRFPDVESGDDGSWLLIPDWPLPQGWSCEMTPVLVTIPAGYPTTAPDNFHAADDLCLASGGEPGNSSRGQALLGRTWRTFSWHLDDNWRPAQDPAAGDNLLTFLEGCRARLEDPN